jgi:5-methylcytosine-specific restriction endonuclease McrA
MEQLIDLYSHLLAYQQTEAFTVEVQVQQEAERAKRRPAWCAGQRAYRRRYPYAARLRYQAAKHRNELRARQNDRCASCACILDSHYEVDHIKPIARGGTSEIGNLRVCCQSCNRRRRRQDKQHTHDLRTLARP